MEYFLIKELVPKKYKSFEGLHNFNYEIVLKKKSNILFSDSYNTLEILKDENGTILFEKESNGKCRYKFFYAECLNYACKQREIVISNQLYDKYIKFFPDLQTKTYIEGFEIGDDICDVNFNVRTRLLWNDIYQNPIKEETLNYFKRLGLKIDESWWLNYDLVVTKDSTWIQIDDIGYPRIYTFPNPHEIFVGFCLMVARDLFW